LDEVDEDFQHQALEKSGTKIKIQLKRYLEDEKLKDISGIYSEG
jgi:hypothetical protein